jgi:hypothetical protein
MGVRGVKGTAIREAVFDGNVVPAKDVQGIQVVDHRKRVKLVETRSDAAIFNIRQPADMKNQLGTAAARCKF